MALDISTIHHKLATPRNFAKFRASSAVAVTFATPDPTNPRIDLVCLAPNFAVTGQASRYVKAGGSRSDRASECEQDPRNDLYASGRDWNTFRISKCASDAIRIYGSGKALIHPTSGMGSQADITDLRTILSIAASNTNHRIATATATQGQLDAIDNQLPFGVQINPSTQSPYTLSTTLLTGDNAKIFFVESANGAMVFQMPAPVAGL